MLCKNSCSVFVCYNLSDRKRRKKVGILVVFCACVGVCVSVNIDRMANEEDKNSDLYGVLGLHKECTATELRNAYKKLAMRWHPDRFSASGNSKFMEEAKKKFQAIQQAYSVLSDANKRFMYDLGVNDSDDDENGMGDFLNEMTMMMNQTKPNESFEELQELFKEMFQEGIDSFGSSSHTATSCRGSSSCVSYGESSNTNKRNSSEMNSGKTKVEGNSSFGAHFQSFCLGAEHKQDFMKGKEEEEFQESPAVDEDDMAGNRRFHLAMMSQPMTLAYLLHDSIGLSTLG
ncbi:DnaJ domain-containing protein [Cephalotus follicularis]|uniref:DnaJ domain-containing protein n=1 Tax=Cephalotus follicularis TaxID=3775 RepID=A0A1Q3B0A9_CEPFO|nr:DnaJ domain-containing protein [Cephalotus follicularis]